MAHGSPRLQICNKCNSYGLIPRFNKDICPDCNSNTKNITKEELKRKLGLLIHQKLNVGFKFRKIIKKD